MSKDKPTPRDRMSVRLERLAGLLADAQRLGELPPRDFARTIVRCGNSGHSWIDLVLRDAPAARAALLEFVRVIADAEHRVRAAQSEGETNPAPRVLPFKKAS